MNNNKDNIQQSAVEDYDGKLTIRGSGTKRNWNDIHYKEGISAKNDRTTKPTA